MSLDYRGFVIEASNGRVGSKWTVALAKLRKGGWGLVLTPLGRKWIEWAAARLTSCQSNALSQQWQKWKPLGEKYELQARIKCTTKEKTWKRDASLVIVRPIEATSCCSYLHILILHRFIVSFSVFRRNKKADREGDKKLNRNEKGKVTKARNCEPGRGEGKGRRDERTEMAKEQ